MNFTDKDKPRAARLAYSRKEAAGLLGISEPTLDRLVKRGLIRPSRALRRPLFAEEELNFKNKSASEELLCGRQLL